MPKFEFYAEVRVLRTPETEASGIVDSTGVILGISEGPLGPSYAVSIGGITNMVSEPDLEATGRVYSREDFYDGSSITVSLQRYMERSE